VVAHRVAACFSTRLAMVDLPEPDRPVNHTHRGTWCLTRARAALSTSRCCQWMLPARRSAKSRVPAATVAFVWRSIRMKRRARGCRRTARTRPAGPGQVAVGDLVEFQVLGRQVVLGVDVDLVLDLGDLRADGAVPIFSQYGRPGSSGWSSIHSRWRRTGRRPPAGGPRRRSRRRG
jgi:hypothetical protein